MIVDFRNKKGNAAKNTAPTEEREKTEFWINVGRQVGDQFVSLPLGVPLDNLKPVKVPGSGTKNPEFRDLQQKRNKLLAQIQSIMAQLEPGEEHILKLEVQIRRNVERDEPVLDTDDSDDSEFGDLLG